MRRGTTPIHKFKLETSAGESVDLRSAAVVYMTYKQDGKTIIEKTKDDMEITDKEITIQLSQADTLAFSTIGDVEIECRARFPDGNAPASCIIKIPVCKILKEGII